MKQLKTRFIRHYHRAKVASGVMSWHGGMPGMACHFVPLWHGNLRVPGTLSLTHSHGFQLDLEVMVLPVTVSVTVLVTAN